MMKTFLQEVAEIVFNTNAKGNELTVVFPNRRAALYFGQHLGALLSRPAFAPRILTIEDFIAGFSPLQIPDRLVLISRLFKAYRRVVPVSANQPDAHQAFEDFFFWGDMLLKDFDEADKYLVPVRQLFRDLSHQKELDTGFDYLTEEQRKFLVDFWGGFDTTSSVNKERFLSIWRRLADVYDEFRKDLADQGLAYEGMLHRIVAEQLEEQVKSAGPILFAGFNALTRAEEKILSFFVGHHSARICWDVDASYVNNIVQEAGKFIREYQGHPVLGKTFPQNLPAHFQEKIASQREVQLFGAPQPIGQAKLMAQVLREQMAKGMKPSETVIVLGDEKLLIPVLHGIAGVADELNVTMGFPLASTPFFNFVELLIDLQLTRRGDHFNHRQVLSLLGHPYVVAADPVPASAKRKEIVKDNWLHIPKSYLATEVPLHRLIFQDIPPGSDALVRYLQSVVREAGALPSISALDREYAFHFMKLFNLLESVLTGQEGDCELPDATGRSDVRAIKSFQRLFRQLVRTQKIPFSGEPLRGLQVMGVLETRNLDFRNVFILSLNEGAFPASAGRASYVPYNIRRAYGLPTPAHQDATYAYLFYRLLQRAENIFLFYNSETDVLGQGEMSRYLQQLLYESGLNIKKHVLHNPIHPLPDAPVTVQKSADIMNALYRLNEGNTYFRGISPSALNSYIECRLQFYFRHIAKVREPNEVEEELDARVLGNFLHDVMENFYRTLAERKGSRRVEKHDFRDAHAIIDGLIDQVFIRSYRLDPQKKVEYAGQRLVVREVVRRFASRILEMDEAYAPFTVEALEQEGLTYSVKIDVPPYEAILGGKIDRVDSKDGLLRIIDYKTGKDTLDFESIASLFSREGRRNKAAFQTLLYALMYVGSLSSAPRSSSQNGVESLRRVVPGLINRMNLFDDDFQFGLKVGKTAVQDVREMFPEFEARLKALFEELYDPGQPFDQTSNTDYCKVCPYSRICYR